MVVEFVYNPILDSPVPQSMYNNSLPQSYVSVSASSPLTDHYILFRGWIPHEYNSSQRQVLGWYERGNHWFVPTPGGRAALIAIDPAMDNDILAWITSQGGRIEGPWPTCAEFDEICQILQG